MQGVFTGSLGFVKCCGAAYPKRAGDEIVVRSVRLCSGYGPGVTPSHSIAAELQTDRHFLGTEIVPEIAVDDPIYQRYGSNRGYRGRRPADPVDDNVRTREIDVWAKAYGEQCGYGIGLPLARLHQAHPNFVITEKGLS